MQAYTGAVSPCASFTSGSGSPWAAVEPGAESPRALQARELLSQRPPGARQRLGFQTAAADGALLSGPPSPSVGSRVG